MFKSDASPFPSEEKRGLANIFGALAFLADEDAEQEQRGDWKYRAGLGRPRGRLRVALSPGDAQLYSPTITAALTSPLISVGAVNPNCAVVCFPDIVIFRADRAVAVEATSHVGTFRSIFRDPED